MARSMMSKRRAKIALAKITFAEGIKLARELEAAGRQVRKLQEERRRAWADVGVAFSPVDPSVVVAKVTVSRRELRQMGLDQMRSIAEKITSDLAQMGG